MDVFGEVIEPCSFYEVVRVCFFTEEEGIAVVRFTVRVDEDGMEDGVSYIKGPLCMIVVNQVAE